MNLLNVAVVGVGALGRHHARILSEMEGVDLVAVAEKNPKTGLAAAEAYQTRWVLDYRELFDEIDAAVVAVPTTYHLAVASEFLQRSIPVLVEKPLAATLEQAAQLVELADANNTLLQVGHIERFNPATRAAWKVCGPPRYIRAERLSPYAFRSTDIGVVHDLMIHDLDLILDLVNSPVRRVEAFGVTIIGGHEDSVQARLTFENGCIADLTANRVNPVARRSMLIWSSTGATQIDFTTREVVRYSPSDALRYGTPLLERASQPGADIEHLKQSIFGTFLEITRPAVAELDALTAELTSFVECVRHRSEPVCDGHQALQAMQVADQILESVATHQWDGHAEGAIGPLVQTPAPLRKAG